MIDLIMHTITFVAWLTYLFPPLACSKNEAAQFARGIVAAVLGASIGFSLGRAVVEVFLR